MFYLLLPCLALLTIFLVRVGRAEDRSDIRPDFVAAVVLWGVILVAGSEALSALRLLGRAALAVLWSGATLMVLAVGGGVPAARRGFQRMLARLRELDVTETVFLASAACLLAVLFLISVISPPNNVDSINVHMVRVVHWAQNQTLEQYAAGGISQLTRPPLSEVAMLNLRQLVGDDRPVALVQWFSFAGILVVVSLIAAGLGSGRRGQLVAAAFAASLPMAVLEASNTKNDLVVSLWVVCLAYLALESSLRALTWDQILQAGAVIGLGLLTKGTFLPAAFPLLLWLGYHLIRRSRPRTWLAALGIIVVVVFGMNLRYWAGNISAHGTPFGSLASMARALELDDLLRPSVQVPSESPDPGPGAPAASPLGRAAQLGSWFVSRAASLMALHSIYPEIGSPLRRALATVPGLFEPGYLASLEEGLWNHEDSAGNLLHLGLLLAASAVVLLRGVRRRAGVLGTYALTVWAGWAALTLITYSIDLWAIRYQMGFFMLCAPIVGTIAGRVLRTSLAAGLAFVLLLAALPYLVLNNTRPLISAPPRTRTASIFSASPEELLFASTPEVRLSYQTATARLAESSCRQVGLLLRSRELEYTLWWLLDAPQSGFRMQVLAGQRAASADQQAAPCAVLCTVCRGDDVFLGMPLAYDDGHLRLYLAPEP